MLTLQEACDFFARHLANETFSKFPAEKQLAAIHTAAGDIAAATGISELPESLPENIRNAIFEQAVFLLQNPHISTAGADADSRIILAPRAKAWLPESPGCCTLRRG